MKLINSINQLRRKIKKNGDKLIELLSINFIYVLGIGITAIIAKVLFHNFLIKKYYRSSWKKSSPTNSLEKMF